MTVRGSESLRSTIGTAGCMRSVSDITADRYGNFGISSGGGSDASSGDSLADTDFAVDVVQRPCQGRSRCVVAGDEQSLPAS